MFRINHFLQVLKLVSHVTPVFNMSQNTPNALKTLEMVIENTEKH